MAKRPRGGLRVYCSGGETCDEGEGRRNMIYVETAKLHGTVDDPLVH